MKMESENEIRKRRSVIVTGFGPFGEISVNASWEAVKELLKFSDDLKKDHDVDLIAELIPVSYNYVSNRVPELWKKYNPIVVIHVGVSQSSKCIEIEQKAHSTGYDKHDTYKELPNESDILERAFQTDIDVKTICSNIKKCINNIGCQISMSDNAGRYLCEYIYYQSLNIDKSRVIFIHVPDISHYPSAQTAKALYIILCTLLKHLND